MCWWRLPADCNRTTSSCMPELVCRRDQPCSKHHVLDSTGISKNAHCCGEILRWCAYALASVLSNPMSHVQAPHMYPRIAVPPLLPSSRWVSLCMHLQIIVSQIVNALRAASVPGRSCVLNTHRTTANTPYAALEMAVRYMGHMPSRQREPVIAYWCDMQDVTNLMWCLFWHFVILLYRLWGFWRSGVRPRFFLWEKELR